MDRPTGPGETVYLVIASSPEEAADQINRQNEAAGFMTYSHVDPEQVQEVKGNKATMVNSAMGAGTVQRFNQS